jgi:hypothetical protein
MKQTQKKEILDPDDLRLRAEARAILQDPGQGPILLTQYVGTRRDSQGQVLGPDLDFTRARVGGQAFERCKDETLSAFEDRVIAETPAIGIAAATFWSDSEDRK